LAGYIGGCFAPPLTDEKLDAYKGLIDALPPSMLKDAMQACYTCSSIWWKLPDSVGGGKAHPSGRGVVIGLSESNERALANHVPHERLLKLYSEEFEEITSKELRDAAFHLLWHVVELSKKREPITNDKL
jgi:hypothetical protein